MQPTINVEPPSTTLPHVYPIPVPGGISTTSHNTPAEPLHEPISSPIRSRSQPPPSSPRKSVQFSETPEITTFSEAPSADSGTQETDNHRHRHHHSHSRGYEAEDDTNSTVDRRPDRPRDFEATEDRSDRRHHHRRRRSHDPSSSSSRDEIRSRRGDVDRGEPIERVTSPADSEATVDLPPRFDEKGRKKAEAGDDALADKFEEILQGKGAAGKVLGNFIDGLFGSDGKKKRSSR